MDESSVQGNERAEDIYEWIQGNKEIWFYFLARNLEEYWKIYPDYVHPAGREVLMPLPDEVATKIREDLEELKRQGRFGKIHQKRALEGQGGS